MYVAEEWAKRFRDETKAAHEARETAEDHLSVMRTQQKQMAEQVKKANQDKASAEAGMNTMEKQVETFRSELHLCQINLDFPGAAPSQPEPVADHQDPKTKA